MFSTYIVLPDDLASDRIRINFTIKVYIISFLDLVFCEVVSKWKPQLGGIWKQKIFHLKSEIISTRNDSRQQHIVEPTSDSFGLQLCTAIFHICIFLQTLKSECSSFQLFCTATLNFTQLFGPQYIWNASKDVLAAWTNSATYIWLQGWWHSRWQILVD